MEPTLAAIRFVHYVAAMFMFGAGFYLVAFAPPDLRAALSPRLRAAAIAASGIAFLSSLLWLAMESASMTGDWSGASDVEAIGAVLTSTSFGKVWQGRIVLGAATILTLTTTRAEKWGVATLLGALLLASLGLVDHAAMQTGALGAAHRANDAVHLLATGGWLGGLAPFAMCLGLVASPDHEEAAGSAMLRFSAVGHFAVALIVITGAINVDLTTHAVPWPPSSPYRALLVAKVGLVMLMIALATVNRYVLLPRLEAASSAARALRLFVVFELGLALGVVALVSYFGLLDPA